MLGGGSQGIDSAPDGRENDSSGIRAEAHNRGLVLISSPSIVITCFPNSDASWTYNVNNPRDAIECVIKCIVFLHLLHHNALKLVIAILLFEVLV